MASTIRTYCTPMKRSGASGEHPASESAPRCPLRGVPGRRVLSIRACLRPGDALTPRRKCSNRAASNFNNRSPAFNFDRMFPIPSATQCGDERSMQKTAVCRARSTHHTAVRLGQPIKNEKNRGITLSLSLSLSLSLLQAMRRGAGKPRAVTKRKYVCGSLHHTLSSANVRSAMLFTHARRRGLRLWAVQIAARQPLWMHKPNALFIGKRMLLL